MAKPTASGTPPLPWSTRVDKFQRRYAPYIFISPFFLLFAVFGLFPIVFSLYLSLQVWNPVQGLGTMRYVGLENYVWLMDDPWFWRSITNTLWIAVASGVPQHVLAIPLAFALSRGIRRFRHPLTAAYFLPFITSAVAVSLVFLTIFGTQFGILNQTLQYLATAPWSAWLFGGMADSLPINWLGRAPNIKPAISILVIWQYFGFNVVLYAAGLATIPKDYYEAASIDGANARQSFFRITLPLLRPMIFFAVSLTIIGNLQLFDQPFILTDGTGGSSQAGMTVVMYLYRTGFNWLEMGTAAAIAWLLVLLIGALTLIHFRFFGRSGLETRD
ncbi:MAG: sugar ABC transporter permease [Vicinamibacterales bacterium]